MIWRPGWEDSGRNLTAPRTMTYFPLHGGSLRGLSYPKVLYHWRCHQNSTASNPESKLYAFEAGSRAIMAHYKRVGIEAERVEKGVDYGIYHSIYKIKGEPLVSVIIPNKDHRQDLDLCIRSISEWPPAKSGVHRGGE